LLMALIALILIELNNFIDEETIDQSTV